MVDITNVIDDCLNDVDRVRMFSLIEQQFETEENPYEKFGGVISELLNYEGLSIDAFSTRNRLTKVFAHDFGFQPEYWPERVNLVKETPLLRIIMRSEGPFLIVHHGHGYDWVDKDVLNGDGSGERRKAAGLNIIGFSAC